MAAKPQSPFPSSEEELPVKMPKNRDSNVHFGKMASWWQTWERAQHGSDGEDKDRVARAKKHFAK